jgi:DNA polymerase elongation subunit (family B)
MSKAKGKSKGKLGPRILTIDIENRPNLGYIWGLFDQNIGITQLVEVAETISFAAKWHGESKVMFYSTYHDGKQTMLEEAHRLLSEADIVVGYNSKGFDMKHLNREFLLAGLGAPAPYAQVDLLLHVRKQFKFTSNKLDFIAQALGLGSKTSHSGFQLWIDCMKEDPKAWALMRKYNKQDVVITEKLYDKLLPWIHPHPHVGIYTGEQDCCPNCGGTDLKPQGKAYTTAGVYQRFKCAECGKWSRGKHKLASVDVRGIS